MFSILESFMKIAIEEARLSLREGHHGFGAVILEDNTIVAQAHDSQVTDQDSTSHAELNAIRMACSRLGNNLSATILLSTHEPCSVCVQAILEARIPHLVYGYSNTDTVASGRDRIETLSERFRRRSKAHLRVEKGLLYKECSILYNQAVRNELKRLRSAPVERLREYNRALAAKRIDWFHKEALGLALGTEDRAEQGYRLLLRKLGVPETEAPIERREKGMVVFHSKNFCPTLEACIILGLDTRKICRLYNEDAAAQLIRQIDPKLRFSRNYRNIRPYSEYCEERIEYEP
jgi:tRNA(adenine34) deaminase